jgi:hypothetical protein
MIMLPLHGQNTAALQHQRQWAGHTSKTGTADSHSPECVIPDDVLIQFGPSDDEHSLLETCRGIK